MAESGISGARRRRALRPPHRDALSRRPAALPAAHRATRIEIHLHRTTLYNSLYRVDDEMIVNTHVYGHNAYSAPVLCVRRMPGPCLFDAYADSFKALRGASTPATVDQAGAG